MARIKIKDLPKDMKISREEMKNITGGDSNTASESSDDMVQSFSTLDLSNMGSIYQAMFLMNRQAFEPSDTEPVLQAVNPKPIKRSL